VGRLEAPVTRQEGAEVTLTTRRVVGTGDLIPVPFPGLARMVRRGGRILLRDGNLELQIVDRRGSEIRCRVIRGGVLNEHQGVNLPGARFRAPSLTAKDTEDLRFGLRQGVDYVALSFVRSRADLRHARGVLRRLGRVVPVVAKLEKAEAIANLDEIIAEADAVMVARGDLGVELPLEQVPLIQKRIIRAANERGIPVITATQMLESMVRQDRPSRAEASDGANAILGGRPRAPPRASPRRCRRGWRSRHRRLPPGSAAIRWRPCRSWPGSRGRWRPARSRGARSAIPRGRPSRTRSRRPPGCWPPNYRWTWWWRSRRRATRRACSPRCGRGSRSSPTRRTSASPVCSACTGACARW